MAVRPYFWKKVNYSRGEKVSFVFILMSVA